MYYAEELIEEIRLQNDIVDVVSEYVQLKKRGSSYFGLCPFHHEKSASFSVSPDKQIYYCFGCGAGGNVISFIMQIENYDFIESIKYLADRANIMLPEPKYSEETRKRAELKKSLLDIHKLAARYFYYNLHKNKAALNYINERQIVLKYQKRFGIGFSNYTTNDLYNYLRTKNYSDDIILKSGLIIQQKNKTNFFDRFFNRLMFPIFDIHNNVIAFGGRTIGKGEPKYLNSPETLIFNKSKNLYGLNIARLTKRNQIIIVEGYMDTIALHQAGFDNAVASLGTAFNIEHAHLLRKYTQQVVLLYDSDNAGTNAILRAIPILISSGLKVKVLQVKNAKDPDEFIKIYGKEEFEQLLKSAINYIDFQINIIKNKYNLEDTDSKIQFTIEVSKLLSKLDNAIEQDAYIKQIAELTKISEDSIRKEILKIMSKQEKIDLKPKLISKPISKYNNDEKQNRAVVEAQKSLLNIIVNNKFVYSYIKIYIQPADFIDACFQKLAYKIYELYDNNNNVYPAEIINYFDNPEEHRIITNVFAINEEFSSINELQKVINDNIKCILKANTELKTQKAKLSNDVQQLLELLEDKRNIDNLNITLTDG